MCVCFLCKRYICSMLKANTGEAKQCTEMVKWYSMTAQSLCFLVQPETAGWCSMLVHGGRCEALCISAYASQNIRKLDCEAA